jgi:hypothetical protein
MMTQKQVTQKWVRGRPKLNESYEGLYPIKERLLDRVHISRGCWIWTGQLGRDDYGRVKIKGKSHLAHRVSWEAYNGPIPNGSMVRHLCNRHACINPSHLIIES